MTSDKAPTLRRGLLAATIAFTLGVVVLATGNYARVSGVPDWARYLPLVVVCIGMVLRRRAPIVGLAIGSIGFIADLFMGPSLATLAVYADNVYAATVHGPRRTPRALLVVSGVFTAVMTCWVYFLMNLQLAVLLCAILVMVLLSPVATGTIVREHRERAELERDRAQTIARLAEVDRRTALSDERTRMARELHDTIANHFSAIAMQSSAVMSQTRMDPAAVREVVASIRANSVAGLADMRRTIEFLRATDGTEDPVQHGLSDLSELVSRVKAAGLDVALNITGEHRGLPAAVDFAAYRIAQEALTNVLKHGRDAVVTVEYLADLVRVTVTNRLPREPSEVPGSGHGLLGMRERATILGGEFQAGPHDGGWRVCAGLPTTPQEKT